MILPKEVLLERDLSPSSSHSKFIYINYQGDAVNSSSNRKVLHKLQSGFLKIPVTDVPCYRARPLDTDQGPKQKHRA